MSSFETGTAFMSHSEQCKLQVITSHTETRFDMKKEFLGAKIGSLCLAWKEYEALRNDSCLKAVVGLLLYST